MDNLQNTEKHTVSTFSILLPCKKKSKVVFKSNQNSLKIKSSLLKRVDWSHSSAQDWVKDLAISCQDNCRFAPGWASCMYNLSSRPQQHFTALQHLSATCTGKYWLPESGSRCWYCHMMLWITQVHPTPRTLSNLTLSMFCYCQLVYHLV